MLQHNEMEHLFTLALGLKRLGFVEIEKMQLGITQMHVRVLKVIAFTPSCTAKDITHFLNRDKAQVTRLLNYLIEQQLLLKQPNPEDKRSQTISLSDSGKRVMTKITEMDNRLYQQMTHGISEEQCKLFNQLIQSMKENIVTF